MAFREIFSIIIITEKKYFFSFRKWITANIKIAQARTEALQGIRAEVVKLETSIVKNMKLKSIQYDCEWNVEHIRGCLKSLDRISRMHENDMKGLEGMYSAQSFASSHI